MPLYKADELIRELQAECAKAVLLIDGGRRRKREDVLALIACLRTFNDRGERFREGNLRLIDTARLRSVASRVAHEVLEVLLTEASVEDPVVVLRRSAAGDLKVLLAEGIRKLKFSTRVTNCFREEQIDTIRELVLKTRDDLLMIRNFGETCLTEVQTALDLYGLRLGMTLEEVREIEYGTLQSVQASVARVLNEPFSGLGLGTRAFTGARRAGAETLGQLAQLTEEQLLGQYNFGGASLREIKRLLGHYGLRLGMTKEEIAALLR
jgi:DNA-directed RNA polymerase alpha subunit